MFKCQISSESAMTLSYIHTLEKMDFLVAHKKQVKNYEYLIFTEHEPVITLCRQNNFENILVSEAVLKQKKIVVYKTKRGGMVTYHGSGQLMAYCIFDLIQMRLSVKDFVWLLEESII